MLNKPALLKQLQNVSQSLFCVNTQEIEIALQSWKRICANPLFKYQIKNIDIPWPLPEWSADTQKIYSVDEYHLPYTILGVDGSQIYPDRHQGTSCFLINIGSVQIHYSQQSTDPVLLNSMPYIFGPEYDLDLPLTVDLVDARRQELELEIGYNACTRIKESTDSYPYLFLIDGSLIFWHLENKETGFKKHFLKKYLTTLLNFCSDKILYASYISMPKSKELINLIRAELIHHSCQNNLPIYELSQITDTTIMYWHLKPGERTMCYKSNASICQEYPRELIPHFFYLHADQEIIRIEIPAWIADDDNLTNSVTQLIFNQIQKGRGYPVVLAEAHEQAVVKGPDRDFFYHVMQKFAIEQKFILNSSQKSIKKRGIGI